jgi:manganese-dependent inorganic pyrophosphatase
VLIVTGGLPVEKTVLNDAIANGVSIIKSPHDTATTAILCRAAISVRHLLTEHVLTFDEGEALSGIKNLAAESQFQAFPVVNEDRQVIGMLSKSDFLKKIARKLILVDHNELSQAVHGADQVEILEIIDHHRIGALTTSQPILFRNEPVGSTSTIVADCFQRSGVELPQHIAGLLLAGLVSDTLNLTSPTTTPRDAEILSWLEKITRVNAARFTEKLFESGSVLISRTPEQAITTDCKEYVEADRRFSVAQIEEIGFDQFYKRKTEVLTALAEFQRHKDYFFAALLVTDVVRQSSLLVVSGDEGFLKQIDYTEVEPGIYELPGVVSRKKQLLPFLTHCLRRTG